MTHEDKGKYAAKHSPDARPDPEIAADIQDKAKEGKISCGACFRIVEDRNVPPSRVGRNVDLLEFRIIQCQLGLFGYFPEKKIVEPAQVVSPALRDAIHGALVGAKIPCAEAWRIAKDFGLSKINVSAACEALKIKVHPCQLGAF
jgi:hypothetical protein